MGAETGGGGEGGARGRTGEGVSRRRSEGESGKLVLRRWGETDGGGGRRSYRRVDRARVEGRW